jgi:bifunctional UDP-N-acetylglucosamine pyrophosphorylase/glucosamine-1-phosphate N-acetyltransferase
MSTATGGSGPLSVVVLAAGFGTRMKSATPKVLHPLAGRPLAEHVLRAARSLKPQRIVVVVGHGAQRVEQELAAPDVEFVVQREQLGTAHAFLQAAPLLESMDGRLLVLSGDGALLTHVTLAALAGEQGEADGMTLLTCRVPDPTGLGRIIRDGSGVLQQTVEEKDATPAQKQVDEIVVGTYLFDRRAFSLARQLDNANAAGEYYITDLISSYLASGLPVRTSPTPVAEYRGVNDRAQLAEAERIMRDRINHAWLLAGVSMHAPETTFIDDTVSLARDVTLEPGVILRGNCTIGEGAHIGAYSVLHNVSLTAGQQVAPLSRLDGTRNAQAR